ncbi:MAG: Flp family type IVb pilin [Dehalococcoidia bacterium]|jgi:Flp pilus assembly pilin Flp|nr:Flp family type IVb pilin [Dehalococcoidia bacterium]
MSYGKLWRCVASALVRAKDERGQTVFEFAMIVALVALVAVFALTAIGLTITGFFDPVANAMGL